MARTGGFVLGPFVQPLSSSFLRSEARTYSEIDYSDIPELDDEFWKNAVVRMPGNKKLVSIRLDEDILNWFKGQGAGYQTKINEVLRTYMRAKAA
jgi:uncharacterized protein (DUF4415 family)